MNRLTVLFSHPWLLLLLIPAAAVVFFPYFRLSKKYRRTRNRILSLIFSLTGLVFTVLLLSGMNFTYTKTNEGNEIILLVDVSETEEQSAAARDDFVEFLLNEARYEKFRVGVVTFGYDQVYAAPISGDVKNQYDAYKEADLPDTSATNVAAALQYAAGLFSENATSKIVLVTDGKETDGNALSVIRAISARGVRIDTAFIPSAYEGEDAQILSVQLPDFHMNVGEAYSISVTIRRNSRADTALELYDNGVLDEGTVRIVPAAEDGKEETVEVVLTHTFAEGGFHELEFRLLTDENDVLHQNDTYFSYVTLDVYNKVLIVESGVDESARLSELLTENGYDVTVVDASSEDDMPKTVNDLRKYDQVVFNNIANKDLPEGFMELMDVYVDQYGGGFFTAGGSEGLDSNGNFIAHAYNREDMSGSLYQKMLPVQAIDYTPPIGVMIVLDTSGSMNDTVEGFTKIKWAVDGAVNCLDVLEEKDYVGLMSLDSDFRMILNMTPLTRKEEIKETLRGITQASGNTIFPGAIERAALSLRAVTDVDKRHIILITDGEVPNDQRESYENTIDSFYRSDGITLSVIAIGMTQGSDAAEKMQHAVDLGGGNLYMLRESNIEQIFRLLIDDLSAPKIRESQRESFYPLINNVISPVVSGVERGTDLDSRNKMTVPLGGYYGVRARSGVDVILVGDYEVPVYAQWKYGKGMVGSFMCDVLGTADSWSQEFLSDENGVRFLLNAINNLMPTENIHPTSSSVRLIENNYTNTLSVVSSLEEGDRIQGTLSSEDGEISVSLNEAADPSLTERERAGLDCYVTNALSAATNFSRCGFVVKKSGVYKIELVVYSAEGEAKETLTLYKAFSYSEEYDAVADRERSEEELAASLKRIAEAGGGTALEDLDDPSDVFAGFVRYLEKTIDPRIPFAILVIVCLLLDVIVRKFKFKWIHEIISARKKQREMR